MKTFHATQTQDWSLNIWDLNITFEMKTHTCFDCDTGNPEHDCYRFYPEQTYIESGFFVAFFWEVIRRSETYAYDP